MVNTTISTTVTAVALVSFAVTASAFPHLETRQLTSQGSFLASNYQNGATPPGAMTGDAAGQTVVIDSVGGGDDASQRPGCPTIFIGSAAVGGMYTTGWTEMPQVLGFETLRDLTVSGNIVQPYIAERGKDPNQIRRVVIVQPGLPRDYWKYANLMRNSLLCAAANSSMGIDSDDVLIVAPAWVNRQDRSAGSAQANDLLFSGSNWSQGVDSYGPGRTSISSFEVLDQMTAKYLDKSVYPKVGEVVVAGHSLGGSLTQHYAMLRKASNDDANVSFFVGNPGAYVWPVSDRPVPNPANTSCAATVDDYQYGLNNLPPYSSGEDRNTITSRYYGRRVIYGLGLADNEQGDTHCEAQYQGTSHLNRGQNFQQALAAANNGAVPASHTFNYVANVSHEDYLIFADPTSQYHLFARNYNVSASNTASSTPKPTSTQASKSTTKSSRTRATASPSASTAPNSAALVASPAAVVTAMLAIAVAVAAVTL